MIYKFRAWSKVHKFMGRVYEISFDSGIVKVKREGKGTTHTFGLKDVELLLFTGLHDKNGVEIYCGDIVRCLQDDWISKRNSDSRTIEEYKNDIAETYEIGFRNGYFCMYFKGDKDSCHYIRGYHNHGFIEVIGTIMENPDLLKGE